MTWDKNTVVRILDANLNRAREAARVLEEYARFGLQNPTLAEEWKALRHALTAASPLNVAFETKPDGRLPPPEEWIAQRNIEGDVGRQIETESELFRRDIRDVVLASGSRLGEALRALEEYGKVLDVEFGRRMKQARYRGYELLQRMSCGQRAIQRFGKVRLYVIITEELCAGDWFATAEAALRGGADCIQIRQKFLSDQKLLDRTKRLYELTQKHQAMLFVNDRPDIAALSGADGVHLGREDISISEVRRLLPGGTLIGISTNSLEEARVSAVEGPDYLAVGPIFATATKPRPNVAGVETLKAVAAITSIPLVAIGGIRANNAPAILTAARCALCVCSAVIGQPDVEAATRRIRAEIDRCGIHPSDSGLATNT